MISIPLKFQFEGPTPKVYKNSPENKTKASRYDRSMVVTPPFITHQVEETIKFTEEQEEKEIERNKVVVDPYEHIKPIRDFKKEPLPDVVLAPALDEGAMVFGSLTSLSPVRTKRSVNFSAASPDSLSSSLSYSSFMSPHRSSLSQSRETASLLGLTLSSDCKGSPGVVMGTSGIRSKLPSIALAPMRGLETGMTNEEFTNSSPVLLHHPSLDCFGLRDFDEVLRPTLERTRLHTPTDVRQKVARLRAERELQEQLRIAAELQEQRRSAQLIDSAGPLAVSSRSTKDLMSVKSSAASSRRSSYQITGPSSRSSPINSVLYSRPTSMIPNPTPSDSPVPFHHPHEKKDKEDHTLGRSASNPRKKKHKEKDEIDRTHKRSTPKSPASDTGDIGRQDSTGGNASKQAADGDTKFFFSENEAQHKLQKLERRNMMLDKRKAETLAKTQQLLKQKAALTEATKSRKAVVTDVVITTTLEQQKELEFYIGPKAQRAFSKLFYAAMNELSKYPNDEDLPEIKRNNPRYLFVREQAKRNQAPLQLLIREKDTLNGVCLGGKGLGDDRMLPVIRVLDMLPAVHVIDFHDNRLTDVSLMPLAQKLLSLKSLRHLDLSFNKIDDSSATIMAYLRSSECRLMTLYLNGADVDDNECGNLMDAISENTTITKLGLSNNLIGKAEPYNTVYPDLITGGEAIGAMLLVNNKMKALDLSWNAIRLASAETLAESLSTNCTLMVLNLEHNSFGDLGTQILGFALKTNHTLMELNLAYNALVPRSASVLSNALSHNDTLTMLNLDGNIIGNVGMQSLVAAIQRSAGESRVLKVSFENCDCKKEDPDLFNPANPDGTWEVDLATPYGRMVAEECFFLANYRAGCNLSKLTYNGRVVKLHRKLEDADIGKYPVDEYNELCVKAANELLADRIKESASILCNILSRQFAFAMSLPVGIKVLTHVKEHWESKMIMNAGNPVADELQEVFLFEVFYSLFVINDTNCSKTMELDEFLETLAGLGKPNYDREIVHRLMADFDLDDSGTVDANEFSMIMVNHFCNTDRPRGQLVDSSTDHQWYIPDSGTAIFQMHYESELPKGSDIGRDEGIDSVVFAMQDAKTDVQRDALFEQAVNSPYFYLNADQAQLLYDEVLTYTKNKLEPLALILPQIVSSEQCLAFLDANLDEEGKLELRVRLGQLYNAYVGVPTGHYALNLEKISDVKGGLRLAATSVSEANYCKAVGTNTSQTGNPSSFRNEIYQERAVRITGGWFSTASKTGIVRCDFASTNRPRLGTKPLSDSRFDRLMQKLKLYEIPQEEARINKFQRVSAKHAKMEAEKQASTSIRSNTLLSSSFNAGQGSPGAAGQDSPSRISRLTSMAASEEKEKKKKVLVFEPLIRPPLTVIHCKEYFTEYMESCHHYLDILPPERRMEGSYAMSGRFERPITPEDFSNGEKPSTTVMPPIFPLAYLKLLEIQIIIPSIYISVEQLTKMLQYFPTAGYIRVQLLQTVFSRLTDLENLWPVLDDTFTLDETKEALFRLGLLNVYDPMFPDRDYKLDLRRWDEREMAKMLIVFANAEPGENWVGETFRWTKYDPKIPGWCLPQAWTLEDGPNTGPHDHGWLTLTYTSYGEGCHANMIARKVQRKRTLVGMKRVL